MTYLDIKFNSMLIFNRSRAFNRVNDKRALLEVRLQIEVLSTPYSGL